MSNNEPSSYIMTASSSSSTPHKNKDGADIPAKDTHSVTKRLQKELMSLMMMTDHGVSAFPEGDNLFKWIGTIKGPSGTVYEGLTYKLTLEFPSGYPYNAPTIKFFTPCFHPNVDLSGNICLDILKEKWSALYDVRTILLSIQSLLGEPNTLSPLNISASELWSNQEQYREILLEKYDAAIKSNTSTNDKNTDRV